MRLDGDRGGHARCSQRRHDRAAPGPTPQRIGIAWPAIATACVEAPFNSAKAIDRSHIEGSRHLHGAKQRIFANRVRSVRAPALASSNLARSPQPPCAAQHTYFPVPYPTGARTWFTIGTN